MSRQQIALISGVTGQGGSYLAEFLLTKGYEVHGLVRRSSNPNLDRISHCSNLLTLHNADLLDQSSLSRVVSDLVPDEVYNLAAQSYVGVSWEQPLATAEMTGLGAVRLLEATRVAMKESGKAIKFFQASSSEMFGKVCESPQRETTPFYPRSPYGVSKLYAHWMTINYRESYGMFAVSGILFNNESPRRGLEFVTRKISRAVARIKLGKEGILQLGNLHARRDWGFTGDYVQAMWLMLQQAIPQDFVIASGHTASVQYFVSQAFAHVGLDWHDHVAVDPKLIRPAEVEVLCGDSTLARHQLGWSPTVDLVALINMMVDADLAREQ